MSSSISEPPRLERESVSSEPGSEGYDAALPGQPWESRRRLLRHLFENIEPKYDSLNRKLSFGIDQSWRRWCAREASPSARGPWVDLASGTGDLAVFVEKRLDTIGGGTRSPEATGRPDFYRIDLSDQLLRVGAEKLESDEGASAAEMDRLPLAPGSIAAIFQGFALRHCRDYGQFFSELHRVLAPGGQALILDMRYPRDGFGAGFYRFYFRKVLPRLAGLFGADVAAYQFMVESVRALPDEAALMRLLRDAGFSRVQSKRGIFGSVRLLVAEK